MSPLNPLSVSPCAAREAAAPEHFAATPMPTREPTRQWLVLTGKPTALDSRTASVAPARDATSTVATHVIRHKA